MSEKSNTVTVLKIRKYLKNQQHLQKEKFMKIKVVILLLISVLMTACGREDYGKKQRGELNTVAVSEEIRVNNSEDLESFEEENKSITNTTEEEGGEYQTEQQYSNASICFEYPAEWELEEHQGEDGCCVRISAPNEEDGTAYELVQGEAWRVNYDYTKEDYAQFLSEKYIGLEISDLSSVMIDGYDAKKLQFIFEENERKYEGRKYMVIVDLVSFEFTYVYPCEKASKYEKEDEKILKTIYFN